MVAAAPPASAVAPRATYRLQLRPGFGFAEAAALVDYLDGLGISHLYLSPCLQAVPNSQHGYDVVDPTRLNDDLGGAAAFERLCATLQPRGMSILLDIVPNHMATDAVSNPWWRDVLEHGRHSRYAAWFDIEWDSPDPDLDQRVLLPILGDTPALVLAHRGLRLERNGEAVTLRYGGQQLPLRPETVARLQGRGVADIAAEEMMSIVAEQHYCLAHWRDADRRANYRRFFSIATLVGLRVEKDEVFDATHAVALGLLSQGRVGGLRVDHIDGLRDPRRYLERLRSHTAGAWTVVEKILAPEERLPAHWPVTGTTGYEFAALVTRLFTDPAGAQTLDALWREVSADSTDVGTMTRIARLVVLDGELRADLDHLARLLEDAYAGLELQVPAHAELRDALAEVTVAMPVYRTYVDPVTGAASSVDADVIRGAVSEARQLRPDLDARVLAFIEATLSDPAARGCAAALELVARFQQTTPAAIAKGVEDTALYRQHRLVSLNDVGADPERFSVAVAEFHAACAATQAHAPLTLLATSTHDTKRSEDVRARLGVLSEIPDAWALAVRRWRSMNERHRRGSIPDAATEYLLYQTLLGAHPLDIARAAAYMEKAAREAKLHTSWRDPDDTYESGLRGFIEAVMMDSEFMSDLAAFAAPVTAWGRGVAVAQTLLKLTCPGVPDIYQGSEVWDHSLVDPDNRRPVDFARRRSLLRRVKVTGRSQLPDVDHESGAAKLLVTARALDLRRRRPELFDATGVYLPLQAGGVHADRVVAFARGATPGAVVVVPRFLVGLAGGWGDTDVVVPAGRWRDELSGAQTDGGRQAVGGLLTSLGVALLSRVA